eukprot:scaffold85520_cov51-Attheya_sp.AAC.3
MGLSHCIDTFMQDLTEHGHLEKEAWTLISDCVSRIYGDLSDARISGCGAWGGTDDVETASACIWATLSVHRVMRAYMRLDFDRHPSVSSALSRYKTKHSANDSVVKKLGLRGLESVQVWVYESRLYILVLEDGAMPCVNFIQD